MPSSKLAITDLLPLPNSPVKIPRLGFGIYQSPPNVCIKSCLTALKAGYRHIDSAQFYQNESEMGEAARQSGIPRNEIFLTTKILSAGGSPEKTYQKCLDSVYKIDGEKGYVDLFLLHSPSGGSAAVKEMYQALEKLESEGKVKSIGVSNFGIGHIEAMKSYARIWPPHVNQIEVCISTILFAITLLLSAMKIASPCASYLEIPPLRHITPYAFLNCISIVAMEALTSISPHSFIHGINREQ